MIAFKILILFLTPFVAGCCRALCFILANANCATTGHGLPSCEAEAILPVSWSALLNGQDVRLPQQPRWLCDRCKKRPGRRMRPGLYVKAFRDRTAKVELIFCTLGQAPGPPPYVEHKRPSLRRWPKRSPS